MGRGCISLLTMLQAVLLWGTLSGCQSRVELHIAHLSWVGYESLTLARDFGWLPSNAQVHRVDSSREAMDMLRDGRVQAAALTLDQVLRLRAHMDDLAVVLVMDESAGADILAAHPDFSSLPALAGARIAYRVADVSELLLNGALRSAQLGHDDVELYNMPPTEFATAYAEGRVDAVVGYPPHIDDVLALGAQVLYDSRSLPGTILDVLVVNTAALAGREETLAAVVEAHFRVLDYMGTNLDDVVYRYAAYQDSDAAFVREALAGVRLPSLDAVRAYLADAGTVQQAAQRLVDDHLVGLPPNALDSLVDSRFLPLRIR